MTDANPFEVSELCQGKASPVISVIDPRWFRVDGDMLVCGPKVVLPKICCQTGAEENLVDRAAIPQYPSLKFVMVARQCNVQYSISRQVARRSNLLTAAAVICLIGGVFTIVFGAPTRPGDTAGIVIGFVMIVVALVVLMIRTPRLTLMQYKDSGHFFVKGFSGDFLQRLSEIGTNGYSPAKLQERSDWTA